VVSGGGKGSRRSGPDTLTFGPVRSRKLHSLSAR